MPNHFITLDEHGLSKIRKTPETPARVCVYDVIKAITGLKMCNAITYWNRLQEKYPDLVTSCDKFQFEGKGQRRIPVANARQICEVVWLLQGKKAEAFRRQTASVLVRFLGGDESLVAEIAANRRAQESLPESHPMRLFGETVEAEAETAQLTRKREQVELAELDLRLAELETRVAEQRSHVKRARVEAVEMGLQALQRMNLPFSQCESVCWHFLRLTSPRVRSPRERVALHFKSLFTPTFLSEQWFLLCISSGRPTWPK